MQPNANPRPIMDVTTSSRPTVAVEPFRRPVPSLPVREAPAPPEATAVSSAKPVPEPSIEPKAAQPKEKEAPPLAPSTPIDYEPTSQAVPAQSTTPVGVITATIFSMLILGALAILVYLKP